MRKTLAIGEKLTDEMKEKIPVVIKKLKSLLKDILK